MTKEQLRMQMLAGIITESQYKAKLEEEDSMGKIGKSYPAPGTEKTSDPIPSPSSSPIESSEESEKKQLTKKARDLYEDIVMNGKLSGSDYLDIIVKNSISDNILEKIAKENGGSLGIGLHKIIKSKFLPKKELKEVIRKLEDAFKILKTSKKYEVDFYYYGWDNIKGKWYDSREED
jgi:hypothetical protein